MAAPHAVCRICTLSTQASTLQATSITYMKKKFMLYNNDLTDMYLRYKKKLYITWPLILLFPLSVIQNSTLYKAAKFIIILKKLVNLKHYNQHNLGSLLPALHFSLCCCLLVSLPHLIILTHFVNTFKAKVHHKKFKSIQVKVSILLIYRFSVLGT